MNTISTAESVDWTPVYDDTTLFKDLRNYNRCNDTEFGERTSRRKNDGFWSKLTSYIKKKEVFPLVKVNENNEENNKSRNTLFPMAWNETYNLR